MKKSSKVCHYILFTLTAVSLIVALILLATHEGYRCDISYNNGDSWTDCPKQRELPCGVPAIDVHYETLFSTPANEEIRLRCPFRESTQSLGWIALTVSAVLLLASTAALHSSTAGSGLSKCLIIGLGLASLIFSLITFILMWIDVGKDDYAVFNETGIWSRDRGGFKAAGTFFTLTFVLLVGLIINDLLALSDEGMVPGGLPVSSGVTLPRSTAYQSKAPVVTVDESRQVQPTMIDQKKGFMPQGQPGVSGPVASVAQPGGATLDGGYNQAYPVVGVVQPGSATLNRSLNQAGPVTNVVQPGSATLNRSGQAVNVAQPNSATLNRSLNQAPMEAAQVNPIPQSSYSVAVSS